MEYRDNERSFEFDPAEIELALKAEAIGRAYDRIAWPAVIEDALEPGVEPEEMRAHWQQLHMDDVRSIEAVVRQRDTWRARTHTLMCLCALLVILLVASLMTR